MGQQRISEIRRQELIQASMKVISDRGFADVTVAQIAKHTGGSTGSIHYYFGGKDALLEATMRHLLNRLQTAHHRLRAGANTPMDRLLAVVDANFDPEFMTRETCRVWTQFWAFAPYYPALARLHRINRSRVTSNIMAPLRHLAAETNPTITTTAIQSYMDGIWVEAAQANGEPDTHGLRDQARAFVGVLVG